MRRKMLIAGGALLGLILVALIAVPAMFSGQVVDRAAAAAEEQLEADLAIGGASISLLRDFPNLRVALDDVVVTGRDAFAGTKLADVGEIAVSVDLGTVFGGGPIRVNAVELSRVALDLRKNADGSANWAITKPKEPKPESAPSELDLALDLLAIDGLSLRYADAASGLDLRVEDLEHRSTGNLAATRFDWVTKSSIGGLHVTAGDTTWLAGSPLDLDVTLGVDQSARTLDIRDNRVQLGDLVLNLSGSVAFPEGRPLSADLAIAAETPKLGALIALLPGLAEGAAKGMQTDGEVTLTATVKGPLGGDNLPAVVADVTIKDGSYRHASVPEAVTGIQVAAHLDSPGPTVDGLELTISGFEATVASNTVKGKVRLARPESAMDLDLEVRGAVDLATLDKLLPSSVGDDTRGVLDLDVAFDGSARDLATAGTAAPRSKGGVTLKGIRYRLKGAETPLEVASGALKFTAGDVLVDDLNAKIGSTDLAIGGKVANLLGHMLAGEDLVAALDIRSRSLDLDEVLTAFPKSKPKGPTPPVAKTDRKAARVPAGYDLGIALRADRMQWRALDMNDVRGDVRVHDQRLDLSGLTFGMLDGRFEAGGTYDSAPVEPRMDLDLDVVRIDLTKTIEKLGFVGKLAPVAAATEGRVSTSLKLGGRFTDGMNLMIDTVGGLGNLVGHGLELAGSDTLNLAATALGSDELKKLQLSGVALNFSVNEGRMNVKPFEFGAGPFAASFGGGHTIGGAMDYRMTLQMPAAKLKQAGGGALAGLLKGSPFAGAEDKLPSTIPVIVKIGGTVEKPKISLDLGAMGQGAAQTVVDTVADVVDAEVGKLSAAAKAEAERRLATAKKAAEAARKSARRAAASVKQKAYAAADRGVKKANGPLAAAAAQLAADQAKKAADKAYRRALKDADAQMDRAIADAQKEYEAAMQAAEAPKAPRKLPAGKLK